MNLKRAIKTLGAVIYKNRSNIEFVAGIVLEVVGTAVIISKAKDAAAIAEQCEYKFEDAAAGDISKASAVKYAVVEYTKCYGFGIGLEALGMGLTGLSHVTDRNEVGSALAFASSTAVAFNNYRQRVIEDVGEEKDQLYLLGPQSTTVEVDKDGNVIQKTEPIEDSNSKLNLPPHCIMFDETNPNWEKDPIQNRDFLENHERWLNQRLQAEGFLWENDIRRDLGSPLVKCGWTSGIRAQSEDGTINYISLGLNTKNPAAQRFRDGIEPSIILQLNVEDNITDKLLLDII